MCFQKTLFSTSQKEMSGWFMTVWDRQSPYDVILRPTSGGWPHVTIAYTGTHVSPRELKKVATVLLGLWAWTDVTLDRATVHSFMLEHGGDMRHDVVVGIAEEKEVLLTREFIKTRFPDTHQTFVMAAPHVTVGIFSSREDAEQRAQEINQLLPRQLRVTGVTID